MTGDIIVIDGVEYEVMWSGEEGLIEDRETKPSEFWVPPARVYNKKSDYWTKPRKGLDKLVVNLDTNSSVEPERVENVVLGED